MYGAKSAGRQRCQSASVTMPESLQYTFGHAAMAVMPARHASMLPSRIEGLAMWSMTKRCSGKRRTSSSASGNWRS